MIKYQRRTQLKTKKSIKHKKNRKIPTLRLDNDAEIPAKTIYIKDINDIDINKIRVSDKKLYNKECNLYK